MSPVEMKVVSEGSAAVGACHTVVSSVFGMQLWKSVRSSGSSQLRLSIASSWRSTSAEWKVRWAAGGRRSGSGRAGGLGGGPECPWSHEAAAAAVSQATSEAATIVLIGGAARAQLALMGENTDVFTLSTTRVIFHREQHRLVSQMRAQAPKSPTGT